MRLDRTQRRTYGPPELRSLGSLASLTLGNGGSYPDGASGTARDHLGGMSDHRATGRGNGNG